MRVRARSSNARYSAVGEQPSSPPSSPSRAPRGSTTTRRVGALMATLAIVVVILVGGSRSAPTSVTAGVGFEPPPLHPVLLFKKPELSTGQLVPNEEGLAVLRSQTEPFTIIAAVGPTRTGKSSILGRAFLRGANENIFEIGSGVTSHTGGVWITSHPVTLTPKGGGAPIRALIMDTEGFSGVGGLTSRTYEANLFAMVRNHHPPPPPATSTSHAHQPRGESTRRERTCGWWGGARTSLLHVAGPPLAMVRRGWGVRLPSLMRGRLRCVCT